jgi:two-component system sporulation sensor kinase A
LERLRQHGQTFYETVYVCRDGTHIPVRLNSNVIEHQGSSAVLSIARDTAKRKWAEEALREGEARYRTLFESAGDAIFIYLPIYCLLSTVRLPPFGRFLEGSGAVL